MAWSSDLPLDSAVHVNALGSRDTGLEGSGLSGGSALLSGLLGLQEFLHLALGLLLDRVEALGLVCVGLRPVLVLPGQGLPLLRLGLPIDRCGLLGRLRSGGGTDGVAGALSCGFHSGGGAISGLTSRWGGGVDVHGGSFPFRA